MRRIVILAVLVTVFAAAAPAVAGVRATLILTSGERVRGVLVDLGGVGFTMLEGGNEVRFAANEVAVIDFVSGGQVPASEVAKMQGGRSVVFQRGGDFFYARLVDIGGDSPIVLRFNSSDGPTELNSNEVARIYLRRWDGMPQGDSGGNRPSEPRPDQRPEQRPEQRPQPGGGIAVPATVVWVDTGIQVRTGQLVSFNAKGEVVLSGDDSDIASPGGAHNGRAAGRRAQMPGVAAGALVGKVGVSAPFGIGNQTQGLAMPSTGVLFLGVNDEAPGDNRGEFRVTVTIIR